MTGAAEQDLFVPIVPEEQLNRGFRDVMTSRGYAPSRAMMQAVFDRMGDHDGNFVNQFQTGGFDARTWELYLFAAFDSLGFRIDQSHPQPDLLLEGRDVRWAIEATTANPAPADARLAPEAERTGSRTCSRSCPSSLPAA